MGTSGRRRFPGPVVVSRSHERTNGEQMRVESSLSQKGYRGTAREKRARRRQYLSGLDQSPNCAHPKLGGGVHLYRVHWPVITMFSSPPSIERGFSTNERTGSPAERCSIVQESVTHHPYVFYLDHETQLSSSNGRSPVY